MGFVVATLIVIVVIASIIAQEPAVFSWAYWQEGGSNTSRSEVVRNIGLLAAGLIGLGVGTWRAYTAYQQTKASQKQADAANEQARIAEQGHITDRYAKAVEMLSSDNVRTRTGAVYALARIAQDSVERDHVPIMAVLSEFVCNPPYGRESVERAKARRESQELGGQPPAPKIPPTIQCPDIVAALRSIAQRNAEQKAHETKVGFRVGFPGANLRELDLERAQLTGAFLMMADLTGAWLAFANLTGADLTFVTLTDATFSFGNLADARLCHVDEFDGAKFFKTNLTGADLSYADLAGADLAGADLTGASFEGAKNIPDLSEACADPDNPPRGLPDDVRRPEPWVPCPEKPKE